MFCVRQKHRTEIVIIWICAEIKLIHARLVISSDLMCCYSGLEPILSYVAQEKLIIGGKGLTSVHLPVPNEHTHQERKKTDVRADIHDIHATAEVSYHQCFYLWFIAASGYCMANFAVPQIEPISTVAIVNHHLQIGKWIGTNFPQSSELFRLHDSCNQSS